MGKVCFRCGKEKELEEFYVHKQMADGRLNKCKACARSDVSRNRLANIEHYRKYDRKRGSRQKPEYLKQYRIKYPGKYKAHNMVSNCIRDGKLFPEPCSICGEVRAVAHHDDYSKPLNVRWLCHAHHSQWHANNGEGRSP